MECLVLTGTRAIQVAHIYPFCLLTKEEDTFGKRHVFWRMLRNFWPEGKITTWEEAIFPDSPEERGLETARNMITLSADVCWGRGSPTIMLRASTITTISKPSSNDLLGVETNCC